jgi:tetratricopeptide (TPR) repeat protein
MLRYSSAILLARQEWTGEAIVEMRRAADLDPRSLMGHTELGWLHIYAREYDAAVGELERVWALAPETPALRESLADAYHLSGRDEEALQAAVRDLPAELTALEAPLRQGFEQAGFQGFIRTFHQLRVSSSGEPCWIEPESETIVLAILGEADAMFECLEQAIDRKDAPILEGNAVYAPYRSDPRFTALLRRMNLTE